LINGGGAITLDLAKAKQEIVVVTSHTIFETINEYVVQWRLESNVLDLTDWDITKKFSKNEVRTTVVGILSDLGFPSNFFDQIFIVTDEGSNVMNLKLLLTHFEYSCQTNYGSLQTRSFISARTGSRS
jgi:hypothetical protein